MKKYLLLFFAFTNLTPIILAQDSTQTSNLISVYLDCRGCNATFIRSEIAFINFVRDQSDSDIHLIITREGTASGGRQYMLNFLGQKNLKNLTNELTYNSYDSNTAEEERNGLVRYVKLGLVPFLANLGNLDNLDLLFTGNENPTAHLQETDKWKSWMFEIGGNTWFSGEESQNNINLNARSRVRRITDEWKFQLNYDYNYRRELYRNTDDDGSETEDIFITDRHSIWSMLAYSLSENWSVGSYFSSGSSSRDNIDYRIGATPAIEYSFYPYRDYARREVTLRYGVFTSFYDYTERTIFGQTSETLVRQELNFNMEYTQPWGGFETRINGRAYMHDLSKNRLFLDFGVNMRVIRGLSFYVNANYSIINDQLSLSADGVTDKEAIANTQQQATSYQFAGSVGVEITFGSIYNNVVNTRL